MKTFANADSSMVDTAIDTGAVYEYKIQYVNSCERTLESPGHTNILLRHQKISETSALLTWNKYNGWIEGVKAYEIWRKVDNASSFTLLGVVDSSITSFNLGDIQYIKQFYLIKAINTKNAFESYSNEVGTQNLVDLVIPNAISPNGDGYNDLWIIDNIGLYKENEVKIFNQWNSVVYTKKGYTNDWDGAGLPDGTYYYIFTFGEKADIPTKKDFLFIAR